MKKMILLFIGVMILYSANIYAQATTMTIGLVSTEPGSKVVIPINVSNFNNVGAISLKISYDTTALTFVGIANSPASVTFIKNATGGAVLLGWFDATTKSPVNISDGKLVDLIFTSSGSVNSVNFVTSDCEISDETGKDLSVTFQDRRLIKGKTINSKQVFA